MRLIVVLFPPPLLPMMQENLCAGNVALNLFNTAVPGLDG
jgi:hypothetical protein